MKVFVTSISLITSIGTSTKETFNNLLKLQSGIKEVSYGEYGSFKTGKVNLTNEEIRNKYHIKSNYSRTSLLGIASVKELGDSLENITSTMSKTCLITGTSVGGMDLTEKEYINYLNKKAFNKSAFLNHLSGVISHQIMKESISFDMVDTISTACSSAANAILQGANYIKNGFFDSAVVGGTDALSIFTINGFNSLNIYDKNFCKPFDQNRRGLNLGEGSAFLILESEKSLLKSGNKPLVELKGWGNSSDAYHQTASSPEGFGAVLSMKKALDQAQLTPPEIGYINAHGTATPNNDLSESSAIKRVFQETIPSFSSTKPYTGHTLASCGSIEAVFSVFSILNDIIFPNLNFSNVISETKLTPITTIRKDIKINNVLSNSFGFGGNNTSLIFSKI